MTGAEILIAIGGMLVGFGIFDTWYWFTTRKQTAPDRPIADGWDQIHHVRIVNRQRGL